MCVIRQGDLVASSTSVVSDDEEDIPIKKKTLCGTVLMNSKKKSTDLSTKQEKDEKKLSLYCSAEYRISRNFSRTNIWCFIY